MEAYELVHLIDQQNQSGQDYLEFLRVPALSAGLYMLAAGAVDMQEPHTEDEIYYVISGRGFIQVDQESRPVEAGRSEERRVGKECRSRWSTCHEKKKESER